MNWWCKSLFCRLPVWFTPNSSTRTQTPCLWPVRTSWWVGRIWREDSPWVNTSWSCSSTCVPGSMHTSWAMPRKLCLVLLFLSHQVCNYFWYDKQVNRIWHRSIFCIERFKIWHTMIDGLFGGWAHFILHKMERNRMNIFVNIFYLFVTKKKKQKRKTPCYGISQLHISYAVGWLLQIVKVWRIVTKWANFRSCWSRPCRPR